MASPSVSNLKQNFIEVDQDQFNAFIESKALKKVTVNQGSFYLDVYHAGEKYDNSSREAYKSVGNPHGDKYFILDTGK